MIKPSVKWIQKSHPFSGRICMEMEGTNLPFAKEFKKEDIEEKQYVKL